MQIVNRPRKEGPSKNAMPLSHATLDNTSSLRLDKDPRWAQEVRDVQLYSCWSSADVSFGHCTPAWFWTVGAKASHGNVASARRLLPCIRALCEKENFQLFHFIQPLKMVHSSAPGLTVHMNVEETPRYATKWPWFVEMERNKERAIGQMT